MKNGWIERFLLIVCAVSVMAFVGNYVKNGHKTYRAYTETEVTDKMIAVTVSGEVKNPGEYRIYEGSRACDAIYAAGGITNSAELEHLVLDAILTDGMKVYVPSAEDENAAAPIVNINTADADMLMLVPGIGEELANRIIDYRNDNGEFTSAEEIKNIRGIGNKKYENLKNYIKTEE